MTKKFLIAIFVFTSFTSFGQIQVSKLIGKNASAFDLGYGGFLKVGHPISDGADLNLEVGACSFQLKEDRAYGWAVVPIKIGYRYTLNKTGSGLYVQPQVGYNVYGIDPDDNKFTGLILAGGFGYLCEPSGKIQFDFGLVYESAFHKGGGANSLSFRVTHNFVFGRRNSE